MEFHKVCKEGTLFLNDVVAASKVAEIVKSIEHTHTGGLVNDPLELRLIWPHSPREKS